MHYTGGVRTGLIRVMGNGEMTVSRRIMRIKRVRIWHSTERRGRKYAWA